MFKIIGADQKQYGPISVEQIRQWIRDGRLNAQTSAQRAGETEWRPLSEFEEFADIFQPSTPAAGAAIPGGTTPAYAPSALAGSAPTGSREAALSAVKGPAIALIIVAALGIIYYLYSAILLFSGHGGMQRSIPADAPPALRAFAEGSRGPLAGAFALIFSAASGFVLLGALKMMKLQGHGLAIATCIVAMLPTVGCCCFLGLPFGIWGLVVLNKPDVKSQFT